MSHQVLPSEIFSNNNVYRSLFSQSGLIIMIFTVTILFQARDIYEEAIQTVLTVRDFTQVFDAYAHFEELTLSKRMEEISEKEEPTEEGIQFLDSC